MMGAGAVFTYGGQGLDGRSPSCWIHGTGQVVCVPNLSTCSRHIMPAYLVGLGFTSGQHDQGPATELLQTLCGNLSECRIELGKIVTCGSVCEICPW